MDIEAEKATAGRRLLLIGTPEKGAIPTLTAFQVVAVHRMQHTKNTPRQSQQAD